jgi:hypothetical protein
MMMPKTVSIRFSQDLRIRRKCFRWLLFSRFN